MTPPPDEPAAPVENKDPNVAAPEAPETLVVGIGASAGGLDAMSELLRELPANVGFGIVVLQHLDPEHDSLLVDLLRRATVLPIDWVKHGHTIQAGRIYVAPPHSGLAVKHGAL